MTFCDIGAKLQLGTQPYYPRYWAQRACVGPSVRVGHRTPASRTVIHDICKIIAPPCDVMTKALADHATAQQFDARRLYGGMDLCPSCRVGCGYGHAGRTP